MFKLEIDDWPADDVCRSDPLNLILNFSTLMKMPRQFVL